eukprot:814155-Pyramimonas_sp.AAC.1
MLVQLYAIPRRLSAFGGATDLFTTFQGILAGCSHAAGILYLITCRALKRLSQVAPCIAPRACVDNISIQL